MWVSSDLASLKFEVRVSLSGGFLDWDMGDPGKPRDSRTMKPNSSRLIITSAINQGSTDSQDALKGFQVITLPSPYTT